MAGSTVGCAVADISGLLGGVFTRIGLYQTEKGVAESDDYKGNDSVTKRSREESVGFCFSNGFSGLFCESEYARQNEHE